MEHRQIQFKTRCPKGHDVDALYFKDELKANIDTPRSDYWCEGCGRTWPMSDAERETMRKRVQDNG